MPEEPQEPPSPSDSESLSEEDDMEKALGFNETDVTTRFNHMVQLVCFLKIVES